MQHTNDDRHAIACKLDAIDQTERNDHIKTARHMLASIMEHRELSDGYRFRFPLETPALMTIVKWIANERLCCPFFTFKVIVDDALWLELTGQDGVKAFIQAEIIANIT